MEELAVASPVPLSQDVIAPAYRFQGNEASTSFVALRSLDAESAAEYDFYRSAKWCPDGSAILAITESREAQIGIKTDFVDSRTASPHQPIQRSRQPSAIWSNAWYPYASLANPSTFCYVLGIGDAPVRLVDGIDGRVRASYSIIDHTERFVAPSSVAFNHDASRLYCGTNSTIEVFEFSRPGASLISLKTTPSRKSQDGQKGLISALTFSSDGSGTFAAGSYSGTISIYSEETGEDRLAEINLGEYSHGITQLAYHPLNPNVLFSASRMSNHVSAYDLRNVNAGPFMRYARPGYTQQRLIFDLDWAGRFLVTGGTDGVIRAFDIGSSWATEPVWQSRADLDPVSSVSMHPFEPLLLSTHGSRSRAGSSYITDTSEESATDSETDSNSSSSREDMNGPSMPARTGLRIGMTDLS